MQLHVENKQFVVTNCGFDERHIAQDAGCFWDAERKRWYTERLGVAARLRAYASPDARKLIDADRIFVTPYDGRLPTFASRLYNHQRAGAEFALARNRSYLAHDPGTGKTPTAITITQALYDYNAGVFTAMYVTPPALERNVLAEYKSWAPALNVQLLRPEFVDEDHSKVDVLVLPDTYLDAPWLKLVLRDYFQTVNTLLIVDEAHRFKNSGAVRSRYMLGRGLQKGLIKFFDRVVFMSGTYMPNRPLELFPVLRKAAPETIDYMSQEEFGQRYCGGYMTEYGWDFSGATNLPELVSKMGVFVHRVRKSEALDLPPKVDQVLLLSTDMPPAVRMLDASIARHYKSADDLVKAAFLAEVKEHEDASDELALATYRRLLGVKKANDVLPVLKQLLEETNEKLIVFAYHKLAIAALVEGLRTYQPLLVVGETPMLERHQAVQAFQANPSLRVIIGNYKAMGEGFTLTKASRVVFVEYSWVPGENDQASDRAHRIGQTESVLVQYVTFQGSVDEAVIRTLLRKRTAINQV